MIQRTDDMRNQAQKKRLREFFFKTGMEGYNIVYYYPTALTMGIAFGLLLMSNMGNAFCLIRWVSDADIMNLDWHVVSWAEPMLGNIWLNLCITLVCAVFIGKEITFKQGESGHWALTEKIKWGKRFEDKARIERKLYKEYKDVYFALDRLIEFRHDAMSPGAWTKMNVQLLGIYDVLSTGHGKRSLPLEAEIASVYGNGDMLEALIEQVWSFRAELSDLIDIWSSSYGFNGVRVGYGNQRDIEALEQIGKTMGIDSIVEGYYNGVPLEDLLT